MAIQSTQKISEIQNTYPQNDRTENAQKQNDYGKTIGKPQLSEKAASYYEQLKEKYGQYDFILVSSDEMANAKANAASYASPFKPVVLIDEDKIEKMATDENFRKQYENILSGASAQLEQMAGQLAGSGASVAGYGIQVGDDGKLSFFAVLEKSSAAQRARIEAKRAAHKAEAKAEAKEAQEEAAKERLEERQEKTRASRPGEIREQKEKLETETLSADSLDDLLTKVGDFVQNLMVEQVRTPEEMNVGQHFDWQG